MKFIILFLVLLSLLVTIINADGEELKCEDIFKVSACNECQTELWNIWKNPPPCGFSIRFIRNIITNYIDASKQTHLVPYNITPYNEAVKESCDAGFSCSYQEAESLMKEVENKCPKELTTHVDWSANPTTLDSTVTGAYGTVLFLYFGIPDHDAVCVKSSNGELCGIEIAKPLVDWIKQKIPEGKFQISFDHKFVYKEDGTRFEIPREFFACGECANKMRKFYEDWPVQHPFPEYLVKNIFGSWEEVEKFYTCPKDNGRMKLKRTFRRSTGFPHMMNANGFVF
ncbi:hypothetical protein C1645_739201 [Glomus cerebriforme]|uniref:Uncharacterized protein n=1 Tax=Glomus cerebriforme TaxID=658196 RepID=A0A397SXH7_9GLOM|nr:hypothetical protein C1645_739201 [Glomus cerebriforme]